MPSDQEIALTMTAAPLPPDETGRLAALASYGVLDTGAEEVFDNITRLAAKLSGQPIALVSLVDARRQWFKSRVGLDVSETHRDLAFCAHAILDKHRPLVVSDATQDARFADNALVTGEPDIRSYAGVPLVSPEGHALGTLCVIGREVRHLDADMLDTLTALARTVETTLELCRAGCRAREMALTDALTGLPNRPALLAALGRAIARHGRGDAPFSLLSLDLDGFKRINDLHGHAEGDSLLREVADAIRGSVRAGDVAARLGGDEFVALLLGGDGSEAETAAERVRAAVAGRMAQRGWGVTASVGVVCFRAAPAHEGEALAVVDRLMYTAKAGGKNQVRRCDFLDDVRPAAA